MNNRQYPKNRNHKNCHNNNYNKVIKINKTFNRDNNDICNYYSNYKIEQSKSNENSINISGYRTTNEYSLNFGSNTFNDIKYNYKSNNNNSNSSSCSHSKYKYIKLKDGEMQLFQKKNQPSSLNSRNYFNKEKIKSRQNNNKNNNLKYENYTTNKTINQFLLNNANNCKEMNTCLKQNKPIRLNYNKDIIQNRSSKENTIIKNNSYDYRKNLEQKINNLKKNIGFEGNDDEFIEYLKIIKLKADITNLVGHMFINDENINDEEIKKCFYKLEQLKKNKNENENLLNIYKYIAEQLLSAQNLHKNGYKNDKLMNKNGNKFNFSNNI